MDAAETANRKPGKPWAVWIALGCSVLALGWMLYVNQANPDGERCPPRTYVPGAGQTFVYSELLEQSHTNFLDPTNPILGCMGLIILMGVGVVLARISNRPGVTTVLVLPIVPLMCCASFVAWASCFDDYTNLNHLETVEFDNHVYQLTFASGMAGGLDVHFEDLYLFECDLTGDSCRRYQKLETYDVQKPRDAKFELDSARNRLQVRAGEETIFTLDARIIEMPNLMDDARPISINNAAQVAELSQLNTSSISVLAWSPSEPILATAGMNGIRLHIFGTDEIETHYLADSGSTYSLAFSPDGQILASVDFDESVYLWDVETRAVIPSTRISYADSIVFSPDGNALAVGSFSGIDLHDVETLSKIVSIDLGFIRPTSIVFSPDGSLLASIGYDYSGDGGHTDFNLWNMVSNRELLHIRGFQSDFSDGLAFSPDGQLLAYPTQENRNSNTISRDNETLVHVWDVSTATEVMIFKLPNQQRAVSDLEFSPDGTLLVTANGTDIILWNVETGGHITFLDGHTSNVRGIGFSPDGLLLASADSDGTIRLWGVGR